MFEEDMLQVTGIIYHRIVDLFFTKNTDMFRHSFVSSVTEPERECKKKQRDVTKTKFSASQDAKLYNQRPSPVYLHFDPAALCVDVSVEYLDEVERVATRSHLKKEDSFISINTGFDHLYPGLAWTLTKRSTTISQPTPGSHRDSVEMAIDIFS